MSALETVIHQLMWSKQFMPDEWRGINFLTQFVTIIPSNQEETEQLQTWGKKKKAKSVIKQDPV